VFCNFFTNLIGIMLQKSLVTGFSLRENFHYCPSMKQALDVVCRHG